MDGILMSDSGRPSMCQIINLLKIIYFILFFWLFNAFIDKERDSNERGSEGGVNIQQRAKGWIRTLSRCVKDSALVHGTPTLPADIMEKGEDPAPPYPGLPMDNNVGVYQAQPGIQAQPGFQAQPGIQAQPVMQPLPGYQPSYQAQSVTYQYSLQQPQFVQPVSQVVMVQNLPEDVPGQMVCPHCQITIVTKVKYKAGLCTWMICGTVALFLCWPCCLIPFCVDDCKDVEHCCPNCERVLHVHKRR